MRPHAGGTAIWVIAVSLMCTPSRIDMLERCVDEVRFDEVCKGQSFGSELGRGYSVADS